MFGTHYDVENINAYNSNLNDRLARKEKRYLERSQQLDLGDRCQSFADGI